MKSWLKITGAAAGTAIIAGAATLLAGAIVWRRASERRSRWMTGVARRTPRTHDLPYSSAEVVDLPSPVARYLAFALPEGQPRIRVARVDWKGGMRLRPGAAWSPFTAKQVFTVTPPGFVWSADVRTFPLVPVRVRDSYVAGEAQMLARLGSVVPVVDERGTPELASGALMRWLGEAAWFPTAFLPGGGVQWEAVNDSTARAMVTDGAVRISAEFHFAPTGELSSMTAMRYRDVNGTSVLTPFEGRYEQYARRGGLMVPTAAEVAWLLSEGRFAYWRAQPVTITYDFMIDTLPTRD